MCGTNRTLRYINASLARYPPHTTAPSLPRVYDDWTPLIVPMFVNLLTSHPHPLRGSRDNGTRRFTALQIRPLAPKTNLLVPKGKRGRAWALCLPTLRCSLPKTQTALTNSSVVLCKVLHYFWKFRWMGARLYWFQCKEITTVSTLNISCKLIRPTNGYKNNEIKATF